ncbi:MAG TPA: hypothetical protein VFE47_00800, partial [Tepidisphaeraceae bacterium]|nr:hypothetical protein [Tepidisphaeraceae bacterium]
MVEEFKTPVSEVLLSAAAGRNQNALAKARWREESREECFQVLRNRFKSPGVRSSRLSSRHRAFASVFYIALLRKSCSENTILDDILEDPD